MAEVQQQLEEVRAGNTRANKAHEAHIGQLISSINELQELCSKQVGRTAGSGSAVHLQPQHAPACLLTTVACLSLQAAELQQCSASQKAQQQELKGAQQAAKRHEEARSKAEVITTHRLCLPLLMCCFVAQGAHTDTAEAH